MQTKKFLIVPALLLAFFAISATSPSEAPAKEGNPSVSAVSNLSASETKQCGVTNAQITTYLQECSHHHTVFYVQDIPGTCNSKAGIENCGTATVFVSGGSIVGHTDSGGFCD